MWRSKDAIRGIFAVTVVATMLAAWRLTGRDLLLFPEVGALTVGLLMVDKGVWRVSKLACLCAMTVAAVIGVAVQQYAACVGFGLPPVIAFVLMGLLLYVTRVQMPPALAAAVMPTVFGIDTWGYVGVVASLVAFVLAAQWIMELTGVRRYQMPIVMFSRAERDSFGKLGIMVLSIVPIGVVAWLTGWRFLIAPPLLVTFAEFALGESGFRRRPWQVLFMLFFGSSVGAAASIFSRSLGIGEVLVGTCAYAVMLSLFYIFRKSFAPAATVALLAMLIGEAEIWTYPVQISLGGAYMILVSSFPGLLLKSNRKS